MSNIFALLWIIYWLMSFACMCTLVPMMLIEAGESTTAKGRMIFFGLAASALLVSAVWPIVLLAGWLMNDQETEVTP